MSRSYAIAAALLSALLFGLAFPPTGWKPLAWIALVPLLVALRSGSAGRAVALACAWSVLAAYVVGDWMPEAVSVYFLQPQPVGFLVFLGIVASMAAPYYAAFALVARRLPRCVPPVVLPLVTAAAWVSIELGRGRLMTGTPFFIGNPWGLIGYSQVGIDVLVQIASVTGVYGIGFAIVAVNAGLAELWFARGAGRAGLRRVAPLVVGMVPLGIVLVHGALALRGAESETGATTPVAIVQGHVDLGTRWRSDFYGKNLDTYLQLTREALAAGEARTVIWPEGALTFFLEQEPQLRAAIARVLDAGSAELVVGGPRQVEGEPGAYSNSIFHLSSSGETAGRYDKEFLVPFTEYVPFREIDLVRRRFEGARTFTPGRTPAPLETDAGRAGVLVCNEAMLPEVAARRVEAGAQVLFNPSNDTWIPDVKFTDHLFDVVSLRAVEQRRYLVRASTSGPSAIVDPWGRVLVRSAAFERQIVLGEVRAREGRSVYARVGDLFAFACLALVAVSVAIGWRRSRAA